MASQLQLRTQTFRGLLNNLGGQSAFLFGGLMLGNALAYANHMIMARIMTPADYGVFVTLTSISYVLAVFMRTSQAWMIRAVSAAPGTSAGRVRALFVIAMRTLVPLGGAAFVGQWLASGWVARFLHLNTATPVVVLGLYVFSTFLVPVPRGILLGLKRLYLTGVIQILEPVARLAAGIPLVIWGLRVNGALTGYAVGNVLVFAVALVPLWPLLRHQHDDQTALADHSSGLDRYALLVLIINASLMIIASVDQIAVKHFFSAEVAGNYAVAFLLGRVIAMSASSLGWVLFARSATMVPVAPRHARLLIKGLLVIGGIAVTLTAGFLAAPALAVRLMSGSQYLTADAYVGLVGIEMTLFALVYVQAYYHISTGNTKVVWPLCFALAAEIALLARYHASVQQILLTLVFVMVGLLVCISVLSWWVLAGGRNRLSEAK